MGGQQLEHGQGPLLVPETDYVNVGAGVAQIRDVDPQLQHPRDEAGNINLDFSNFYNFS